MDAVLFGLLGCLFTVLSCIHCLYRKGLRRRWNHIRELTRPTRVVPVVHGVEVEQVPPNSVTIDVTM